MPPPDGTRIYAIAQRVFDGQVLQLQSLFCDQKTAEQRTPILSLRLPGSYRTYTTLVYLAYICRAGDVVTPVGRAHAPIKGKPNLQSIGFSPVPYRVIPPGAAGTLPFPDTHQASRQYTGACWYADNCRIYRRLNRGMRYTLSTRGPTTKSGCAGRVIGEGFHAAHLVSGMQNSVEHRNSALLLRQNRARRGTRRGLIRRTLIGGVELQAVSVTPKANASARRELKMCSQVAPGYEIEK